jgi:signal peptidase I
MPTTASRRILTWIAAAIAAGVLVTKTFYIENFKIPQNGMFPSLPAGSRVFASKRAYSDASRVKRGDVVVFVREENGQRYNYIWRVIGLPGETVETLDEALTINGQPVQRKHVRDAEGTKVYRETIDGVSYEVAFDHSASERPPGQSITIPPAHFFVMGDNRFKAVDSRYFGPISFHSIIGRKL